MIQSIITLRQSTDEDLSFLFNVSTQAMLPVSQILDVDKIIDSKIQLEDYKSKFKPDKIQIIVFDGCDVGRLRVVDKENQIYIGGIQILPQYQNLGIGTWIFEQLIERANISQKTIMLEVHKINTKAISFYDKLGFKIESENQNQFIMVKFPKVI